MTVVLFHSLITDAIEASGGSTQLITNTSQQTHNVTEMEETSIEEIMEDSPPDDLNEVMEWVFGDYQAERESETEDEYDSD